MGTAMSCDMPAFLYHWSPVANEVSIRREGLRPGNLSREGDWTPPHVCYGETPSAALGLAHDLDGTVDLWMVRTAGHDFARLHDGETVEWRTTETIPAWWVALRPSERACLPRPVDTRKVDPHRRRMRSILTPNSLAERPGGDA